MGVGWEGDGGGSCGGDGQEDSGKQWRSPVYSSASMRPNAARSSFSSDPLNLENCFQSHFNKYRAASNFALVHFQLT